MAGSLRLRGKDSWELRVHAGRSDETGKKRYVARTVRGTKRAAERALAKLVTEVESGVVIAHTATMGQLCQRWYDSGTASWSPTVVASYRSILDHYVLPKWGRTPLRRLRAADLDAWYTQLHRTAGAKGKTLAPNTIGHIHAVIRRALNQGVKWGWIAINPALAATPPRIRRTQMTIPDPAAIGQLVAAAKAVNPALPVFVRLAAVSGARRGELCALRWRDLDLEAGVLHIGAALVQVGNDVIEKDTKTHAERRVSIDARTIDLLAEYRSMLQSLLDVAEVRLSNDAFVFSHAPDGAEPWRPNYVTLAFGRLAKEQGLTGLRLHDLRHFAATTMLVNGVDVRTAAGRLGHAQTSTTLDVYAHFVKIADEKASDAVAAVLDGHDESEDAAGAQGS